MGIRQLKDAFDEWRRRGEPLVLATVTSTEGSTYSKAGAQMLIAVEQGEYRGLLSGGCLEGDLVEHARSVLNDGRAKQVSYDMRNREEDELWGLGLGCDGAISILLQPLLPQHGHQPFSAIAERIEHRTPAAFALVIESTDPHLPPGAAVVVDGDRLERFGVADASVADLGRIARARIAAGGAGSEELTAGGQVTRVLAAAVVHPPRLLVLGGGPDAAPLVRIGRELGWQVTVADHRPAHVSRMADCGADQALLVVPAEIGATVNPDGFDGAVIMSHHLQSDREYLRWLAGSDIGYIGLLGPRARRARLLEDLGEQASAIAERVYGPVGLDIGADSPEGIALAIAAELHAVLRGASTRPLALTRG